MRNLFGQVERKRSRAGPGAAGQAASGTDRYIRVAVERGIDSEAAGEGLTYRSGGVELEVGQRVEVPLGRGNRLAAGIVVAVGGAEVLGDVPAAKVKPIARALASRLPGPLVELAQWMAEYYICPLGMVLATMMPAAVKQGIGLATKVELEPSPGEDARIILESGRVTPAARRAWEGIGDVGLWPVEPKLLASKLGLKNLGPINRLLELGLLRRVERQVVRTRMPWESHALIGTRAGDGRAHFDLTEAQRKIAEGVSGTLGSFSVHLIRGVTGSGKTEVYMRVIRRAVDAGKTALVLVPEISLTPQTAGRFYERFRGDGGVAVLHSGLSASERHRQWALAASGGVAVVVGARSAVFAPVERLGVIVVDEEHATDYKQDQAPRYHGRDVAIKRGQMARCPVVLGSATPSLESWANAKAGKYRLWELNERVGGGRMPGVEIVDLAAEQRMRGGERRPFQAIGDRLEAALRETLAAGGQAILLLNRRGHSSYICCPDARCGWVMGCEHCDAAMVLHRVHGPVGGEVVRCHHCLAEQLVPRLCPVCARRTRALGVGTQRLEEELAEKLGEGGAGLEAGRTMVRVDGDTMRTAKDYFGVLERFSRGEVKLLLGTQMIAKGLDFPNVRLVGVVNADTGLALPDFRAAERTFQLVSQVAGRAGRGAHAGRVIVQTINPKEAAIVRAAAHDYVGFAEGELAVRKRSGLPPVTRMARIVVRDEDFERAQAGARELAGVFERQRSLRMMGPGPCPISRIAGQFRFGIELIARTARELQEALGAARRAGKLRSDARTAVDVDPVALM